ncbi:MAG: hypothetical protein BAJALOKI1v1_430003 [Promethearchaeota archaeon]|nr:MAG: hypothetical protein BAJALOKI1v1_430003 [Candidatus Lokiarchaeota archaeon]
MANTFTVVFKDKTANQLSYKLCVKEIRYVIINEVFRNYSICSPRGSLKTLLQLPYDKVMEISEKMAFSQTLSLAVINKTLNDVYYFSRFFKSYKFPWEHEKASLYKKLKLYLHKIHKIAPIFDYQRAKINLKTLHKFFDKSTFWPTISTQLAMTLYITDLKDSYFVEKLILENVRALTYCSAYAFYRTKNKLIEKGVLSKNERYSRGI